MSERLYADLHEHLARLDRAGLLHRIDAAVDKDTELHPLVRWQYRGGIAETERKAFLFTNVVDGSGRRYDIPVAVGAYAATSEIYRIGMNVATLAEIGPAWERAIAAPVAPRILARAPCQEITVAGGLTALPVPVSTPGFDAAPYLTATGVITRDPDTGVQNMGTYRGQLKAPDRLGMMMLANIRAGGLAHWHKYRARREPMPVAIVVGAPPVVAYQGPQKLRPDLDELWVAGGLAGCPINVVRATTVDLLVPAEAEIVIEGLVATDHLEPEGPFGESHGYVALEDYNTVVDVRAITRRRDAVFVSILSQVTPSESSVVKRLAYEPMMLVHLRDRLGIAGLRRVALHEPLTNLRRFVFLQFARGTAHGEIWRGLRGALTLQAAIGKYVVAIDQDIDPDSADAVLWAMAYRADPGRDMQIVPYREAGHGPRSAGEPALESSLLIDATMKHDMPPLALPKREFMERAKALWERLDLPPLRPEAPWFGYTLGDWTDEWDENARAATRGDWAGRSESYRQRRRSDVAPNTPVRAAGPDEC